jgi:PAS domain S-box-containing protein
MAGGWGMGLVGQQAGSGLVVGGGEAGAWIRAHNWMASPLGPIEGWPAALRIAVNLLLASPDAMFLAWGPELTFLFNDAYRPILGARLPSALGATLPDLWHDSWDQVRPLVDKALAGEASRHEDMLVTMDRHGAPEKTWWSSSYAPLRDEDGRVAGLFCITRETTAHVQSGAALRASEARSRQILDSSTDYAIIATGLDGRITRWNEGARHMLGWTEEEMLGQLTDRFFTPEDRAHDCARAEMHAALATGRGTDERWHLRADGSQFWASGTMMPLKNDDGTVNGFVKVLRDRTYERRREQRLVMLSRAAAGLLDITDPDEVLGFVLEQSRELLGFDQSYSYVLTADGTHLRLSSSIGASAEIRAALTDAALDQPICQIVAQTLQPLVLSNLQANTEPRYEIGRRCGMDAFAGFPVIAGERLYGVLSFGSCTQSHFDAEALTFFATLARYVAIVRKRLETEATLRGMAETLEKRIEERTVELQRAEEALRQSQKMEAVGQLTGGLAHDFNNLLTGITGSLELLQNRITQGRTAGIDRYITAAQAAATRAAALTHRLLAFSRQQTLDPRVTDLNRLVAGMEELIRRTIGPEITLEPLLGAGGAGPTLVDQSQLENALLNLCINARDAMPDGGRLIIETGCRVVDERSARKWELPAGRYVMLCVSDNGSGMTPEVLARAFDPFFTTKPIGQGTGLGLSMIYGFAKQSEGQVRIHSKVGQGTTVCLYLPRYFGEAPPAEEPDQPDEIPHAGSGETVLVIDDEPTVRMLVVEVLESLGYRAIEAEDGAAGLEVLQSGRRIDLLITDVGLPNGMNGRQVASAARVMRPGLRVLFITGYAENTVFSHGHLEHGMRILTKPFAMETLASRIRELLTAGQAVAS